MRSIAFCLVFALTSLECTAETPVVNLSRTSSWRIFDTDYHRQSTLRHEIARQAFLVAARCQMGARTRDAALGETWSDDKESLKLVWETGSADTPNKLKVLRIVGDKEETVDTISLNNLPHSGFGLAMARMEVFSRKAFVKSLNRAGVKTTPVEVFKGEIPESCQNDLREMNFISQYRALRTLHKLPQGGATKVTAALAMAYANLALLTENHWLPHSQVFRARSLIYGERMVKLDGSNPDSFRVRAYVKTLAGLHRIGLEDWVNAEKRKHPDKPDPQWQPLVKAFAEYDYKALEVDKDHPYHSLAQLLGFVSLSLAGETKLAEFRGREILSETPENYRVCDELCKIGGIGTRHSATVMGPIEFSQKLYPQLDKLPDLREKMGKAFSDIMPPPEKIADEPRIRHEMTQRIKEIGRKETNELSYQVLARIISDTSMSQSVRRATFLSSKLGVSPDEYLDSVEPLVKDHPYHAVLEAYRWDEFLGKRGAEKLKQLPYDDLNVNMRAVYSALLTHKNYEQANVSWTTLAQNTDYTARGWSEVIQAQRKESQASLAPYLLQESPHSPLAQAILVEHGDAKYLERSKEWEKKAVHHARLASAFGRRYRDLNQPDKAETFFRAAIKISPEMSTYTSFAYMYEKSQEYDKWQAVLEEYLQQPDTGLGHSNVCQMIANHHMARRNWDAALPFAIKGAQAYSASGLLCAAICCEGAARFPEAEKFYQALSQRYRGTAYQWHAFCFGTGFGEVADAQRVFQQYLERLSTEPGAENNFKLGRAYLYNNELLRANKIFSHSFARQPDPMIGLLASSTAEQSGDFKTRDSMLSEIAKRSPQYIKNGVVFRAGLIELAKLFAADIKAGGKANFDLKELDAICRAEQGSKAQNYNYFVGDYLARHGKGREAIPFLARSAQPPARSFFRRFAGHRLLELNVKPAEFQAKAKLKIGER
ncbi:MAG: hypothetical protein ACI9HK_002590 [Pirellulaceae bacterium]|jgi:hypothetical protein